MKNQTAIGISVLGALLLVGAGVSAVRGGPNAEAVCAQAADRFILCVERHSTSAAEIARGKRDEGIGACTAKPETVQMYVACLPKDDCHAFTQCTLDHAKKK